MCLDKTSGQPNTYLPTGIYCDPEDLDGKAGIDGDLNPTANRQLVALETAVQFAATYEIRACRELTTDLIREAIACHQKNPSHLPNSELLNLMLDSVEPTRILTPNQKTARRRRCWEVLWSIDDPFVQNPAINRSR